MRKLLVVSGLRFSTVESQKNFLSSLFLLANNGFSLAFCDAENKLLETSANEKTPLLDLLRIVRLFEGFDFSTLEIPTEEVRKISAFFAEQVFTIKNTSALNENVDFHCEESKDVKAEKAVNEGKVGRWKEALQPQLIFADALKKFPFLPNLIAKCQLLGATASNTFLLHCNENSNEHDIGIMPLNEAALNGNVLLDLKYNNFHECASALAFSPRIALLERNTSETKICVRLNLDGKGNADINTGLHFFNHMLTNFTKHSGIDLSLHVEGDLEVDEHHTIEDVAIALGNAFAMALGEKHGISRYGFSLPMDEAAASCLLDFGGRIYLQYDIRIERERVGDFPTEMLRHFFDSFAQSAKINLHIASKGKNDHHVIEASFKAMARAFKMALQVQGYEMPSTKGVL